MSLQKIKGGVYIESRSSQGVTPIRRRGQARARAIWHTLPLDMSFTLTNINASKIHYHYERYPTYAATFSDL